MLFVIRGFLWELGSQRMWEFIVSQIKWKDWSVETQTTGGELFWNIGPRNRDCKSLSIIGSDCKSDPAEPAQGKARLNGITNPSTTVRDSKSRTAENAQDNHSPPETSSGQVV